MSAAVPPVLEEKIPSTGRLMATLGLAGLLSGLILVGAHVFTLPIITANKAEALRRAVFEVVPESGRMQPLRWTGSELTASEGEGPVIYAAYGADGAFRGYAVRGEGPGFQDTIALLFGFDPGTRKIVGLWILQSRETPGLGDKIFKDERWVNAFRDLAAEPEVVATKDGAEAPNEVDAITGATISSKAVARIVNAAMGEWLSRLPEPGSEPALGGGSGGGS